MEEHAARHGLRAPPRALPVDAAVLYRLVSWGALSADNTCHLLVSERDQASAMCTSSRDWRAAAG
jgi:hypothetical protein